LAYSCPIVEIVLVIGALEWCKEAIALVFKDHIHELQVKVIRVGPRLNTIRC
jgi:hypothetical protein